MYKHASWRHLNAWGVWQTAKKSSAYQKISLRTSQQKQVCWKRLNWYDGRVAKQCNAMGSCSPYPSGALAFQIDAFVGQLSPIRPSTKMTWTGGKKGKGRKADPKTTSGSAWFHNLMILVHAKNVKLPCLVKPCMFLLGRRSQCKELCNVVCTSTAYIK